ncbi:hypothetical protein, partial [Nitrobacter sp.]|uniref:hypothetical protein n=1 Tax=Nitrobacter sp. TaxID=29420 RepID=UPI0032206874
DPCPGVPIGCRLPRKQGPYSTPKHRVASIKLLDPRLVFLGKLEQALFGEGIGSLCEAAAAFCLLLQKLDIHDVISVMNSWNQSASRHDHCRPESGTKGRLCMIAYA